LILVTGGAGFIGANFILDWLVDNDEPVVNLDKLTYAGNAANLATLANDARYEVVPGDIGDRVLVAALLARTRPRAVLNFAAESHVDRSIHGPAQFIQTNLVGTFNLLETVREYWMSLAGDARNGFRLLHVSTDEVYGSLTAEAAPFTETSVYQPNSPYSASKAGSDHLVRAWHHTYGLPVLTTNCSNNYGPMQFPEKLIPLMIAMAGEGRPLPVYGDGANRRDWLYVSDHCEALRKVLAHGRVGEVYNVGGNAELSNLEVVTALCSLLDSALPAGAPHARLIKFVTDRPGHDRRYAIDAGKIRRELGWQPRVNFKEGLRLTVAWYLEHQDWVRQVQSGDYRNWIATNYRSGDVKVST
jgi:dTDP-glucose 4,6-dehydratase